MSQLDIIPPHLRKRSISEREIVLPLADALEAIDYLEHQSALILGWEGWIKAADGRVGHGSAGYLSPLTAHLSVAEAAADARKTIQAGALDWEQKHGGGTDTLHFCITVRSPTHNLSQFFGAWFHQDWHLDDESWQSVVRRFVAAHGSEVGRATAESILALVQAEPSDAALADVLARLGCEYWPGTSQAVRPWLIELANELRRVSHG